MRDCIGDYYRGGSGDTRSLGYSSYRDLGENFLGSNRRISCDYLANSCSSVAC